MPVVVLRTGEGMEVDDRGDPVAGKSVDNAVEVPEAIGFYDHGLGIVLKVAVVDGDTHRVDAGLGEEAASASPKKLVSRRSKKSS